MIATQGVFWDGNVWEVITAACAVLGLVAVLIAFVSLHHSRSSNFVSAWTTLRESMQKDRTRAGRAILRRLTRAMAIEPPSDEEWLNLLNGMREDFERAPWYLELMKLPDNKRVQRVKEYASAAYDEMDLAGILVLQSRIPGLVQVLVLEYTDSIIQCFEQGKFFLVQRMRSGRHELYECFCVLYELALECKERRPALYPHLSFQDRWARGWSIRRAAKRARSRRESLKREVQEQ